MDVTARHAVATDAEAVTALVREGRRGLDGQRGATLWVAREAIAEPLAAAVGSRIDAETSLVVIGTIDDCPLGVLILDLDAEPDQPEPRVATVRELFVVADARGVGLGEAMMDAAVAWATDRGCHGVDGYALPGDRATKNFFETFGLVARGIVVHRRLAAAP